MTVLTETISRRDAQLYTRPEDRRYAPFEVVLRYSTQKQVLAEKLAARLNNLNDDDKLDVLDIGSSKGTLIAMLAGQLREKRFNKKIQFSLLEPDASSVKTLKLYAEAIRDGSAGKFSSTVIQRGWEEFNPGTYDAIICSHVIYHFNPRRFEELFLKMIHALKPGGRLFVSAREQEGNEVFRFIHENKARATGETFNEITIADVLPALESIVSADSSLSIKQNQLQAEVTLPFASKPEEAKTIVAFFLQRGSWSDLPYSVRRGVLHDYAGRDSILSQFDRLVEITRAVQPTV